MVPLLFTIMDESISPYLPQNLEAAGLGLAATYDREQGGCRCCCRCCLLLVIAC